jgi:periplasmic divalent cation tolerance protein
MESEFVLVYTTFPDETTARNVGELLVAARLAACVNIYPPILSIYEWQGKLEAERETAAFIKTRRTLADEAIAAARELHPYSVPCFLVLPVSGGDPDYLAWLGTQTVPAQK